jgi:excisionase family DNA binding protein
MKTELEPQDIQAIAEKVLDLLKPYLTIKEKSQNDLILDVKSLCEYLKVDESWVYKQVSLRSIPFFKAGKYTRFRRSAIDRWIDRNSTNLIDPSRNIKVLPLKRNG